MKTKLLLSFLLLGSFATAQNISTVAGTGTGGYNGDNISATSAWLNCPQGVALDPAGNIYTGDLCGNRIRKIDGLTGIITTVAGTGTAGYNGDGILATAAQISNPSAITFDLAGNLYFTDRSNHRIRKITMSTGIITTVAGTGTGGYNGDGILATTAQLNSPNEVSFDSSGNLYIADWINNRVRKIDHVTNLISTIAGTGTAGYNGENILATSAQINGPCGIIFDYVQNIYIAEYGGHRIRKIDHLTNLVTTIAGTGTPGYNGDNIPATAAQLYGCAYIKFDLGENMYIGDAGNQRVRRITTSTGIITTVAGTGTAGYNGDGIPATTAQLSNPFSIYFDRPKCNMYIGDYSNNRLRKVTGGFVGCTPLPLNLLFFQGENKGSYNLLKWKIADANFHDDFVIERSGPSKNFEAIGSVNGISNGNSGYFSFTDHYPLSEINYYRLKRTDINGAISYSQIISITNQPHNNLNVDIYPNPGKGKVTIMSSAIMDEIKIFNQSGRIIYHEQLKEKSFSTWLKAAGIYFIQVSADHQTAGKKIIVYN